MTQIPEISIVVPCHNEQGNLRPLTDAIRAAIAPLHRSYEVVLVNDGSSDGSWELLKQLGATDPHIRGLNLAAQSGQSAAMWAGLRAARGQILMTLDADMQNPPAEIPRFLEAMRGADCVCGSRVEARAQGDSWLRLVSSRVANWVRNKVSGETISDAGCCFRAFKRECVADVKFFKGGHRFLPTLIKMEGFKVVEIPIRHDPRHAGEAHYGVWNRLFKSFTDLLAVRWMKKRIIHYKVSETIN
ncbi:MAG: glycosyltransferase [Verrucomicrobia bacterium]|nr:MAG: glycosyltransferase [Verrucomicrobiota bacterium]